MVRYLHRGVLRQVRDFVVMLEVSENLNHFLLSPERFLPGFVGKTRFSELSVRRVRPVGALPSALGASEVNDSLGQHYLLFGVSSGQIQHLRLQTAMLLEMLLLEQLIVQ